MAWLNIFILLSLTALVYSMRTNVEIEFNPPGPHKAGATIKVVCKTSADQVLDAVKLVKLIDGTEYEISTNDFMSETFMNTKRYSMSYNKGAEEKVVGFTIKNAKGEDSGMIECKHLLINGDSKNAQEEFKIIVPPQEIKLKQYRNRRDELVTGDTLVLKEGEDNGVECEVTMMGSQDLPQTTITLDGRDAMNKFSKEENKTKSPNGGLVQMSNIITYEYLFDKPDLSLNGQRLACSAHVEGFDFAPLSTSATIEVHYSPRLQCEPVGAEVGEMAEIKCSGHMHPKLDLASVTWKRKPDIFTLTQTEPNMGDTHHFNVTDEGDGVYAFSLVIKEVKPNDFGNFKFEVQNAHSSTELKIKLNEAVKTTTSTTTTISTTTTEVEAEPPKTDGPVASASMLHSTGLLLLISATLACLRS